MAAKARTLTLKTKVEVTGADKLNNLGKKFQKAGAALTLGVTTPLALLGGVAAKAASNLNESLNAVNVTFGKTAQAIQNIGKTSADAFGLSQRAFNEVATRFSAFATTVAGEGGDVAVVIEDITRRGSDFASVFNLEVDDALALFQSGLAGETEPLRRFGLDLSAAAVEAHAVKVGISDGTSALTEAQKVQARYSLLMEQTSKVQGDFARTSGEVANQQRIAAARAEDAAAKLGQKFLPIQQKVIEVLSGALDAWSKLPAPMQDVIVIFGVAAAALGPLLAVVGTFMRAGGALITLAPRIGAAFHAMLGPIGLVTGAISLLAAGFATDFLGMRTRFEKDMEDIGGALDFVADRFRRDFGIIEDTSKKGFSELSASQQEAVVESGRQWQTYNDQISAAMYGPDGAVPTVTGAADAMAGEAGDLPEAMADELLANQFHLKTAIDEMVDFMDQALSPAQEVFNARAFLSSQEYKDGLNSGIPAVRLKAQELGEQAVATLEKYSDGYGAGASFSNSFAYGMKDPAALAFIDRVAASIGARARRFFPGSEPKEGPLKGITKAWGFTEIFAKGLLSGQDALDRAFNSLLGGGISMPSLGLVPAGAGAGAGGSTVINNFYLQWDGEPPKGRTESEIVSTLQRLHAVSAPQG